MNKRKKLFAVRLELAFFLLFFTKMYNKFEKFGL